MDIEFDVNKVLEEIAKGLNIAVEKLYPMLYKQAMIDGVMNLIWIALIIAFIVIYFKYAKFAVKRVHKGIEKNEKWNYAKTDWADYPMYALCLILGGIASLVLLLVGIDLFNDTITAFFNTDYYIIEKIVGQFRGL